MKNVVELREDAPSRTDRLKQLQGEIAELAEGWSRNFLRDLETTALACDEAEALAPSLLPGVREEARKLAPVLREAAARIERLLGNEKGPASVS